MPSLHKRTLLWISRILAGGIVLVLSINILVLRASNPFIVETIEALPQSQAILILGTTVRSDGSLAPYLRDRVDSGLKIFQANKADKIIVSGDHGSPTYNEVQAMKDYLVERGVAEEDIFMDHAGFDTYDSLYRAKHIFQVESLIIVSQNFHVPRAVYIGNELGISSSGYPSERFKNPWYFRSNMREWLARIKAFADVQLANKPTFEGEIIPITGDGRATQD